MHRENTGKSKPKKRQRKRIRKIKNFFKKLRKKIKFPRIKFKINNDTLSSAVIYSLLFCAIVEVACFIAAFEGVNVEFVLQQNHELFGKELAICFLLRLYDCYAETKRKREEMKYEKEQNQLGSEIKQ